MKRYLAIAALALSLGACSVTPGGTTPPPADLKGYTIADLTSTGALAQANNDLLAYNCDQALIGIIGSFTPIIPTTVIIQPVLPPDSVEGLAYRAEEARLVAKAALNAADTIKAGVLTPAMRAAFAQGCGPLVLDFQMDQVRTVADVTSLMSKIAAIP